MHLETKLIINTRQNYKHLTIEYLEEWMKLILWEVTEEVAFKEYAEVITVEEVDVAAEEDFIMDVDKEADMAEEAGKTWDINSPDPMPEWWSVTMACR